MSNFLLIQAAEILSDVGPQCGGIDVAREIGFGGFGVGGVDLLVGNARLSWCADVSLWHAGYSFAWDRDLATFARDPRYFSADTGGFDWGTEFDAAVIYTAPWKQKFSIKYSDYNAKDHATDTDKIWLWTSWGF